MLGVAAFDFFHKRFRNSGDVFKHRAGESFAAVIKLSVNGNIAVCGVHCYKRFGIVLCFSCNVNCFHNKYFSLFDIILLISVMFIAYFGEGVNRFLFILSFFCLECGRADGAAAYKHRHPLGNF